MGQDSKRKIHGRKVACFKATGCRITHIASTRIGAMDDLGLTGDRKARNRKRVYMGNVLKGRSVNRQEFQRLSGLTQPTIREHIKRGLIEVENTGRGARIPWSEVVRLELDK